MKRTYPEGPIPAVGAVVLEGNRVLLIRRGVDPYVGLWSVPGGAVELGEEVAVALKREVREESGLEVEPLSLIDVYDNIVREGGRVRFHYLLVDYLCRRTGGDLRPGTDTTDARWVPVAELDGYEVTPLAREAIRRALEMTRTAEE